MTKLKLACLLIVIFMVTGCITPWKISTGNLHNDVSRYNIDIQPPLQWNQRFVNQLTLLSRNGPPLDVIVISRQKWTDTLSNGYLIPANIMLHQIPEIILGEVCADGEAFNMTITQNTITIIDEVPASQTCFTYTSPNSLIMRGTLYCIPFEKHITLLFFEAEASNYYERSIDDFDTMVKSITVNREHYRKLPGT